MAGPMNVRIGGIATGDFHSTYHIESDTRVSSSKPSETYHSSIDGGWLGPCPAGVNPGSVVLENGTVLDFYPGAAPN